MVQHGTAPYIRTAWYNMCNHRERFYVSDSTSSGGSPCEIEITLYANTTVRYTALHNT